MMMMMMIIITIIIIIIGRIIYTMQYYCFRPDVK